MTKKNEKRWAENKLFKIKIFMIISFFLKGKMILNFQKLIKKNKRILMRDSIKNMITNFVNQSEQNLLIKNKLLI